MGNKGQNGTITDTPDSYDYCRLTVQTVAECQDSFKLPNKLNTYKTTAMSE